ncbi:hypothetical protein AABB24_005097, partial [Solanum stoloniferum]
CHFLPVVIAAACFLLGFTCCIVLKSSIISMGKHHILTQINTLQRLSFANKQKVLTDTMDDFGAHISPAKETKAILFTDKLLIAQSNAAKNLRTQIATRKKGSSSSTTPHRILCLKACSFPKSSCYLA